MKISIVFVLVAISAAGCGVKGKPLPPLQPAEIGRGVPTYKRTAEEAKPKTVPSLLPSPTPASGRSGP